MLDKDQTLEEMLNDASAKIAFAASALVSNKYNNDGLSINESIAIAKNQLKLMINTPEYKHIFNNTNAGIVYLNAAGDILLANNAFLQLLQYSWVEIKQLGFSNLEYPGDLDKELTLKKEVQEGQREGYSIEKRYIQKDGTLVWTNSSVSFFRENPTAPGHYIIVLQDITDKKKYEQQLIESNAAKDKFFSIISHDLRNPIGSMQMLSKFIDEELKQNNVAAAIEISNLLSTQIDHTHKLLTDLLEWGKIQTKQIAFEPQKLNLEEILAEQVAESKVLAGNKHILLEYETNKQLSTTADASMLKTILRNLITNAIKFSYENSSIKLMAEERADDVLITVEDHGQGISPYIFDKLFQINFKVTTPGTNNESGTGLGLLLCKEFVELHGGKIWAESVLDKGSKFLFTLPK